MAENEKRGRVMKVVLVDKDKKPIAAATTTQQAPEDDWKYTHGLVEPPFDLESLVFLAEKHPIHDSALEQKAVDIVGKGSEWRPVDDSKPDEKEKDSLDEWLESLPHEHDDMTLHDIFLSAWLDVETVGHGAIEVMRDNEGKVKNIALMPGHTVRFAKDGFRVAQERGNKRVWFKRWGSDPELKVDRVTGGKNIKNGEANEVLVLKKPARRSTWYGIPIYVSAIGWIHLSLAARDDNIKFFNNAREPRWAIVLKNLEDDPDLEDDLQQALSVDLAEPHRNLVIPITGPGDVEFKALATNPSDMSFERLQARSDQEVLISHRIPPDRLGLSKVGPLGGNVALASSLVYKEAYVEPSQALLSKRVNKFIKKEGPVDDPKWLWRPEELDVTTEQEDIDTAATAFKANTLTLNEVRARIKAPPLPESDPRGNMLYSEIAGQAGGDTGPADFTDTSEMIDKQIRALLHARE